MSGVFVSYRRDDASGWAGRLYEHLVREWGTDQVFIDIDAIGPGEDFREAIARTMQACDVVLVVIGPNWVNARDQAGNRRLDDESDTHRAEVVAALAADVRVVPVLVGGATMPAVSDLPGPVKDLVYRNAAVIEDRRFGSDVRALQEALQPSLEAGDHGRGAEEPARPEPRAKEAGVPSGRPAASFTAAFFTAPTLLTVVGALLVLIWGVLLPRSWHNEGWGIRFGAGCLLLGLAAAGLWSRQWRWVVAAGVAGIAGFALWMVPLLNTHSSEVGEIFSPSQDGVPNVVTWVGALLVLAGGVIGMRGERASSAAATPIGPRNGHQPHSG